MPADSPDRAPTHEHAGRPPRMMVNFLGLVGPSGALPRWYTQELILLDKKKRQPFLDFLDLFHHRLISLFYRAWEKYRVVVGWERARHEAKTNAGAGHIDPFSDCVLHLIGLGPEAVRGRMAVADERLLFYSGLFAQRHRSAAGLARMVSHALGAPARVIPLAGHWLHLPRDQQTRVGRPDGFSTLGRDAIAGRRVWDDASLVRVRIGPLDLPAFRALLPGEPGARRLADMVRFYLPAEVKFRVQLVLRAAQVPEGRLARDETSVQLGRVAWIGRRDKARDADDAVFRN
jgi:type VI secretion system protein ImpH